MGLDMYLFAREADKEVEEEDIQDVDIAYWRKHNRLHGWMENLYRDKVSDGGVFNCVDLELTSEDLDRLESDVNDNSLPPTQGFFFGDDSYSYEDKDKLKEYDLECIKKAREQLSIGMKVFYSSWW